MLNLVAYSFSLSGCCCSIRFWHILDLFLVDLTMRHVLCLHI